MLKLFQLQRAIATIKPEQGEEPKLPLLPEHPHTPRAPIRRYCQQTSVPFFVCDTNPKVRYLNH